MNLIQKLDDVCPHWRMTVATDPLVAAVMLGLIDEDQRRPQRSPHGELDFNDDKANVRRLAELVPDDD